MRISTTPVLVALLPLLVVSVLAAQEKKINLEDIERDNLRSEKLLKQHHKQYRTANEDPQQHKGPQVFYSQDTSQIQQQQIQQQQQQIEIQQQQQQQQQQSYLPESYQQQDQQQQQQPEQLEQQQQYYQSEAAVQSYPEQSQGQEYQIQQQYYTPSQSVPQIPQPQQQQQQQEQQYFYPQQQPLYYQPQQQKQQPGITYVTDNHLTQLNSDAQQGYSSKYATPQYYYIPSASTSVQNVVEPKGYQYIMFVPQQQLTSTSSKGHQYSPDLYTQVIIPTTAPQSSAIPSQHQPPVPQQEYIQPEPSQLYQPPAPAHAPASAPVPSSATVTIPSTNRYSFQYLPSKSHGIGSKYTNTIDFLPKQDIFAKLLLSLKKEPKSLLDSYVPSILQYQYYKQQEALAKANSLTYFERRRSLNAEEGNDNDEKSQNYVQRTLTSPAPSDAYVHK